LAYRLLPHDETNNRRRPWQALPFMSVYIIACPCHSLSSLGSVRRWTKMAPARSEEQLEEQEEQEEEEEEEDKEKCCKEEG